MDLHALTLLDLPNLRHVLDPLIAMTFSKIAVSLFSVILLMMSVNSYGAFRSQPLSFRSNRLFQSSEYSSSSNGPFVASAPQEANGFPQDDSEETASPYLSDVMDSRDEIIFSLQTERAEMELRLFEVNQNCEDLAAENERLLTNYTILQREMIALTEEYASTVDSLCAFVDRLELQRDTLKQVQTADAANPESQKRQDESRAWSRARQTAGLITLDFTKQVKTLRDDLKKTQDELCIARRDAQKLASLVHKLETDNKSIRGLLRRTFGLLRQRFSRFCARVFLGRRRGPCCVED